MVFEHLGWFRNLKRNWNSEDVGRSSDTILSGHAEQRDSSQPIPRLRVERVDGGLLVAGVEVGSSCQRALPISGCIFFVIGTVLTVIAYQGQSADEDQEAYQLRQSTSTNSRVLGPVCLAIALVMLCAGLVIYLLANYARSKEQKVCFHCPIHGDFFPLTPVPVSAVKGRKPSIFCAQGCPAVPPEPPPCPYAQLLSARNSVSSQGSCPAPKPFIINNSLRCVEYFWPLTANNDIASFPASRTPSPTPINQVTDSCGVAGPRVCTVLPEVMLVAPAEDTFTEVITHNEETLLSKTSHIDLPPDDLKSNLTVI